MTEPVNAPATAEPGHVMLESAEESVGHTSGRVGPRVLAALGVATLAVYAALATTAVLRAPTAFFVLLLATQALDLLVVTDDYVRAVLARGQFGIATRSVVRELATAILVMGTGWAQTSTREAAAATVLGVGGLRLLYQLVLVPTRRRATLPVETRGIDLSGLRIPAVPHPLLITRVSERTHGLSAVALVGAALGVATESPAVLFSAVAAVLLVESVLVGIAGSLLVRGLRSLGREQVLAAVQARVGALRPEVMLYHSGDDDSAYQANMWLTTMDQLPRSAVVILRERPVMRQLRPSRTPVLCIPDSVDFMTFALPDVRVALYTANVGKTIHMLREPGVRHVFIGHGDSDKSASANPFSKVYSEIWVAGEAGRDRYRRANIGIHGDDIMEVGRPQLSGIASHTGPIPGGELTVLYAPTWEGWTNDPAHTSVIRTGPRLVEQLLALPDVRVIYKPHPTTGSVSSAAAASDARIRESIARASRPGAPRHEVAVGISPGLYDCFNACDVLVADISSVLTDFMESQKPYVVPNLTGLDDDAFRAAFPSASAAYLLDPAAEQIGATLDLIRASDPLAARRHDLKHYLLGPDDPDALTRFIAAVDAAYDRAVALCPVRPTLAATAV